MWVFSKDPTVVMGQVFEMSWQSRAYFSKSVAPSSSELLPDLDLRSLRCLLATCT